MIKTVLLIITIAFISGCRSTNELKASEYVIPPEPVPEGGWMFDTEN